MHVPPARSCPEDGAANRPPSASAGAGASRLWLFAGTGEGPPLARRLLQRGWRLRVSLVSAAGARAYPLHPRLELAVGALGESTGESAAESLARQLRRERQQGDPFRWLVDATHPFACRISADLARVCGELRQPLLRLQRPPLPPGRSLLLEELGDLPVVCRPGERLLLAIGARRLEEAIKASPGALHHARVLPSPQALRLAMAVGLEPQRLACLRPGPGSLPIEIALCRRWQISTVLCRQSGGEGESRWHQVCEALGLRLLLLRRPPEPSLVCALELQELLQRLGASE